MLGKTVELTPRGKNEVELQSTASSRIRRLYAVSALHGFSDCCAKLCTPFFVYEYFGNDFIAASAFFTAINTGQSLAEFALNPLLGTLSDRFGRKLFLMAWPPVRGSHSPLQPSIALQELPPGC